ncbi:hypothetical protein HRbin11_02366 [bacterium HR11]|nr:hypothetical protein HRbin11_02366 [bacterium HR11]
MGRMRSWLISLVGVLVGLSAGLRAHGQESFPHIWDYQVTLDVRTDGRLVITEAIGVDFGPVRRHGIYRRVPFRYERPVRGLPTAYNLRVRLISVTDPAGRPYRVREQKVGDYVEWRIGDPDRYVQGRQTYVVRYEVQRGLLFLPDHDELYWNCIGHEWEWPIRQARCTVVLPEGVDPAAVRTTFYTGPWGSRGRNGRSWTEGRRVVFETGPLAVGEGLTVVVGWPKGIVRPPAGGQDFVWWVTDNGGLLLGILLPPVVGGFLFLRWWRHGRDPVGRQALVPQYRPPAGLTPAEVGVLLDERADPVDVTATIIDLAVRGYLRIREEESPKMLIFKHTDYVLEFPTPGPSADTLKDHERIVYAGLRTYAEKDPPAAEIIRLPREGSARTAVRLSDLKEKFYGTLRDAQDALYRRMTAEGYFAGNPQKTRNFYQTLGGLLLAGSILAGVAVSHLGGNALNALALGVGVALTGGLLWLFGPAMPRRTTKGVQALWEILGFREFIRRVEQDRLERLLREDPNLFDRVLPYALVFGVADEWAEKFQGLLQKPPDWYESPAWTPGTFRPQVFMHSLSHSVSSMNSVLPSSPSRSSGFGGGGSGFGGGGSSGGGGGGGGGGGW